MQAMCAHWISAQSRSVQTASSRSHGKPAQHLQLHGGLNNSMVQCIGHSSSSGSSCEDAGHLQACVVPSISADLSENGAVVVPEAGRCDTAPGQHQKGLKAAATKPAPER